MAINKKLLHFKTLANFKQKLEAGEILDTSIVYIKDAKIVWTHGTYYGGDGDKDPIFLDTSSFEASGENTFSISEEVYNNMKLIIDNKLPSYILITDSFIEGIEEQFIPISPIGADKLVAKLNTDYTKISELTLYPTAPASGSASVRVEVQTFTLKSDGSGTLFLSDNGEYLPIVTEDLTVKDNTWTGTNSFAGGKFSVVCSESSVYVSKVGNLVSDSNYTDTGWLRSLEFSDNGTVVGRFGVKVITTANVPTTDFVGILVGQGTVNDSQYKLHTDYMVVPNEWAIKLANTNNVFGVNAEGTYIGASATTSKLTLRSGNNDIIHTKQESGSVIGSYKVWDESNLPNPATITNLNESISDTVKDYLPLAGGKMTGNIGFPRNNGVVGANSDGSGAYIILGTVTGSSPESTLTRVGTTYFPTYILSTAEDLIHNRGGDQYKIWDAYNLPDPLTKSNFDVSEMLAYGVEWDATVSNPDCTRIGNPTMHKTLPIQSQLKGCIAKGNKIQYYLNPNDWSLKEDGTPSVLDGTDGEVKVHVPKFYGKSGINGNKRWVKISTVQIDGSWIEIPEMLIDAYRCTVNTTNQDTPVTASVVNTTAAYRGGGNRSARDTYDQYGTDLGKPRTSISRTTMRNYVKNKADGSALFNYEYYKWVMYWLPVIEYATFNSQKTYNAELTSEGYHQGGLGAGLTDWDSYKWNAFNGYYPLTQCGYTNEFGNFSGVKEYPAQTFEYTTLAATSFSSYYSRTNTTLVTSSFSGSTCTITNSAQAASFAYVGFLHQSGATTYSISGLQEGQGIQFTGGGIDQTVTSDGDVVINWSSTDLSTRYLKTTFAGACNITITITDATSTTLTVNTSASQVNRYRGFENIFGDIWTNLDGIIIDANAGEDNLNKVYTSINPEEYNNSDYSNYRLAGHEIHTDGYIKTFDLQETGEIIPASVGGGTTTYKCDYHYVGSINTILRTLLVGGRAHDGGYAGLGGFNSAVSVGYSYANVGFRTYVLV